MALFERLSSMGHEEIIYYSDPNCGLKAIVAIHNTVLGPALGGTRLWPYQSEEEALEDVLRLSKGMSYKASLSGLNLGGGKAVILADPKEKSEAMFRSYGKFLNSLGGRYITAEDMNIGVEDIEHIYCETRFVCGVDKSHGGSGNPSPYTALGVFRGIEAACLKTFGNRSVKNKVVALQGIGSVGRNLAKLLHQQGATLIVCDVNVKNIEAAQLEIPFEVVSPNDIYDVPCDIYSPCAMGATLNDSTVERLKCKIVAGAANNQLKESRHGSILKSKNILYAPDYLINAGGLMNVSIEFEGWTEEKAQRMVNTIYEKTLHIFKIAEEKNFSVNETADFLAEERMRSLAKISGKFFPITAKSPKMP